MSRRAIGVVREKETGSIANFRSTPISRFEFLFGKQLPYIAIAMISFAMLVLIALFVFRVPIKGSAWVLVLATLFYVSATTGFGQLISSFTRTQVAAVFATAILSIIPAVNFSGLMVPVASLSGGGRIIGMSFPPACGSRTGCPHPSSRPRPRRRRATTRISTTRARPSSSARSVWPRSSGSEVAA